MVWLITAVPLNWINFCGLFSKISEVLELLFHFTTKMTTLCLTQSALFVVENVSFSYKI